jgi:hypothetical protein
MDQDAVLQAPQIELPPPQHAAAPAKKRKGAGGCAKDEDDKGGGCMRLPEVVAQLASEAQVLQWVESEGAYLVIDGPGFERRFNELRMVRGKKVESAAHRPFSRMHTHFVLVRGEKWAGTGSMFRYKEKTPDPSKCTVSASDVSLTLRGGSDSEEFTVTLQHFLDITGAGAMFRQALTDDCSRPSPETTSPASPGEDTQGGGEGNGDLLEGGLELSGDMHGLPMLTRYSSSSDLGAQDVASILGAMWDCNSKGDQAYFFHRKSGLSRFANGMHVFSLLFFFFLFFPPTFSIASPCALRTVCLCLV